MGGASNGHDRRVARLARKARGAPRVLRLSFAAAKSFGLGVRRRDVDPERRRQIFARRESVSYLRIIAKSFEQPPLRLRRQIGRAVVGERDRGRPLADVGEREARARPQARAARDRSLHCSVARAGGVGKRRVVERGRKRDRARNLGAVGRQRKQDMARRIRGASKRFRQRTAHQHRRIVERRRHREDRVGAERVGHRRMQVGACKRAHHLRAFLGRLVAHKDKRAFDEAGIGDVSHSGSGDRSVLHRDGLGLRCGRRKMAPRG